MARMLPADVFSGCPSPGEREMFACLKDSPLTRDWIVLHSLDLAHHVRQVSGEADFVVIIPSKGVLCLEVKACTLLRRTDAGWYYGTDPVPDPRGPFRQAAEAMHSIRGRLQKKHPDLAHIVFWSAVVFPYVEFSITSGEWHPWQVIDCRLFRASPLPATLVTVLDRARELLSSCTTAGWFDPRNVSPTVREAEDIAQLLRPSFEVFESPKLRQGRWSEEVRRYTEEQFAALDALETNPRVLFTGPAGTGKTLLAIETVRRCHSAGRRCLFLCFNRLLGHWLAEQVAPLQATVTAATFHSYLLSLVGGAPPEVIARPGFWDEELPARAIEALIEREPMFKPYDEIVVDEAQDLLRPAYLDVLDLLLSGGLAAGRWRFFGDLEKQAIYSESGAQSIDLLRQRAGIAPVFALRANCRNSPRIASLAHLLGGLTPDYTKVLRPDNGIEPELLYYGGAAEQEALFIETLEAWHREGITGQQVAVLSSRADAACVAARVAREPWQSRLRPYGESTGGYIPYSSIHAFKGLEAAAVLVTDIEHLAGESATDLFYVAVTRALHRLTILVHETARTAIVRTLVQPARACTPGADGDQSW